MDLKDLYSSIKTLGRLGSGSGITGMSAPYAAGARILLFIFKDANLIPESIELDVSGQHITTPTKSKTSKSKYKEKPVETIPSYDNETISALGKLTVKDVGTVEINDQDTFGIAEMYLNLLKKKIQNKKDSESNEDLESTE